MSPSSSKVLFRVSLLIFLMALIAYSYFFHRFRFWNVNSRLALTYAIVDKGSLQIDDYVNHPFYETFDRALYKGHYYSDKIIGLSLLGVPVYWLAEHATGLFGKDPKPDFSRYAATVAIVSLSSSLLMVVLLKILLMLGMAISRAASVVLFSAFGTMIFPFSCLFYPYLPSLFFLMLAFLLILRAQRQNTGSPVLIGGLLGLSLLCEYTLTLPAAAFSLLYFFQSKSFRKSAMLICAGAVPLLIFAFYNYICFDTVFTIPYRYLEDPQFSKGMSQGLMGIHHFQWYVLYLITLHPYRGIFFYSPFLLLGLFGLFRGLRKQYGQQRYFAALFLGIVFYYLWLNASYYMWWGGGTPLARHLIPSLPFLVLGFIWYPKGPMARRLLIATGIISIVLMSVQSVVEPHYQPKLSNEDLYFPWQTVKHMGQRLSPPFLEHSLPEFLHGRISMNPFNLHIYALDGKGWTLLPLLFFEMILLSLLWRTISHAERKVDVWNGLTRRGDC